MDPPRTVIVVSEIDRASEFRRNTIFVLFDIVNTNDAPSSERKFVFLVVNTPQVQFSKVRFFLVKMTN